MLRLCIPGEDPDLPRRLHLALLMALAGDRGAFEMTTPSGETGGGASWFYGDSEDVVDLLALEAPDGSVRVAWHSRVHGGLAPRHAGIA